MNACISCHQLAFLINRNRLQQRNSSSGRRLTEKCQKKKLLLIAFWNNLEIRISQINTLNLYFEFLIFNVFNNSRKVLKVSTFFYLYDSFKYIHYQIKNWMIVQINCSCFVPKSPIRNVTSRDYSGINMSLRNVPLMRWNYILP